MTVFGLGDLRLCVVLTLPAFELFLVIVLKIADGRRALQVDQQNAAMYCSQDSLSISGLRDHQACANLHLHCCRSFSDAFCLPRALASKDSLR